MTVGLKEHIAELKKIHDGLVDDAQKAEESGHKALALAQKMREKACDITDKIVSLRKGDET